MLLTKKKKRKGDATNRGEKRRKKFNNKPQQDSNPRSPGQETHNACGPKNKENNSTTSLRRIQTYKVHNQNPTTKTLPPLGY